MGNLKKNTTGNLPANASDLLGGLQNMQRTIATSGGLPFLRLLTDGVFVYGQENIEVEEGSLWAANPYTAQHGWACWNSKKSELLDEIMVPMNQPKPLQSDLPDLGHDWSAQVSIQLQCVSGDDVDVVVLYKGTSKGQRDAMSKLLSEIITQLESGDAAFVPVVLLESSHYNHKTHGRTYIPHLTIDQWTTMDGIAAEGQTIDREDEDAADAEDAADEDVDDRDVEDAELVEEPKPTKSRRKSKIEPKAGTAATKKPADKKEPAPATRRRRRASGG